MRPLNLSEGTRIRHDRIRFCVRVTFLEREYLRAVVYAGQGTHLEEHEGVFWVLVDMEWHQPVNDHVHACLLVFKPVDLCDL